MTALVYELADLVAQRLDGQPGYVIYRGDPSPTPTGAYVVLYFGAGSSASLRQDGQQRQLRWSFRVVCAGRSDMQALNTVDRVRARLLGWRPQPDRSTGRLVELFADPPLIRDDSAPNDIRYSVTLLFQLTA